MHLLSGRGAVDDISWREAVVEAAEADLPSSADQALALLIDTTPTSPWQVDALLRRIRQRGFTGLALTTRSGDTPTLSDISVGSRALADRLGLILISVARPTRFARACWELLQAPEALMLTAVRRVVQSIEYRANDLADLLQHVHAAIGEGIALVDTQGVLQSAGAPIPHSVMGAIGFTDWLDIAETDDGFAASVPVESPTRQGLRVVLHSNKAGVAHRNAVATAVQVVMPMVAARLLIDEVEAVNDASRSSALLGDFLEQRDVFDAEVDRRMVTRGWRTSGHHVGFRMIGRRRVDPLQLLRFVTAQLADLAVDSHATVYAGGVSGWLSLPEPPSQEQLGSYVGEIQQIHRACQQTFPVATGIGSLTVGRAGLATTLQDAADAAVLAADRKRAGYFVRRDDLGLEQFLLAWTTGDQFTSAASSLLSPLARDEQETLSAFLDEESSTSATAQRLGIHRNTVSSRIVRIQDALGVDLYDAPSRLALQLALRAVRGGCV